MIKAFLSHSSKDKDHYVRRVANWLGRDNIEYDEFTFEEGEKPLDEILKALNRTSIFVIFLSENALKSDWVQREIVCAKTKLNSELLEKVFPIIIDENLTYTSSSIPDWLREYNLKPIKRAQVAARRIHHKLREISWSRHPELKERQNLFVGRTKELGEFESRIHDFEKEKPTTIVVSGMAGIGSKKSGVGRRTFLHRALIKTAITQSSHKPSSIYLDRDVSIEDFILKLNDLGLVDIDKSLLNLTEKTIKQKIAIIHEIMTEAYKAKEIIYILDDGCIINYKRQIAGWFKEAIANFCDCSFPVFGIASRYKVIFKNRPRSDKFYFVELNELTPDERKMLLNFLLGLYKIDITSNIFKAVSELLSGYPDQIMFAADLIKDENTTSILNKLPELQEYNNDRAATLLSKYESNENAFEFIRLLAQFEVITQDFIFDIVPEEDYYPILEELASEHICELIGVDGEIIRLNDIVREYIKRNRLFISEKNNLKIQDLVKETIETDHIFLRDSSEYIFTMKEALKNDYEIDNKLLIPSHYLRCMKDLYYTRGSLDKIIDLADIILQKKDFLDPIVLQDIQYYLCLALAKKKDIRLLKEVQSINGDEYSFLLGFYYRLCGRYEDSLNQLEKIANAPYVGARSKREIIQVYVQLEEYDKALDYAKRTYNEHRGNQFHTQAYFNCLINSSEPEVHRSDLKRLIKDLRSIDSDQSNEMADIAESMYIAKVENNEQKALDHIQDAIGKYPNNHYPLLAKCDIALKYRNIPVLENGISKLDEILKKRYHLSRRTVNKYKAFLCALKGDEDGAISFINKDISRYPQESKERVYARIKACAENTPR